MGQIYFNSVKYSGTTGCFVKPEICSLTEREIGVWTDGKPLYEKSYTGTISSTQQTIEDFGQTTITMVSGVGMVAKTTGSQMAFGMLPSATNWQSGLHITSNTLKLFTTNEVNGGTYRITIRYTKNADTAGSGTWTSQGVPAVHYSTSEQVVGTWIDGGTIYEKTIMFQSNVTLTRGSWTSISAVSLAGNEDIFIGTKAFLPSHKAWMSFAGKNDNGTFKIFSETAFDIKGVIIQYTKAST